MSGPAKPLGVMRPLGGGDPIPLKKEEMLIGRRSSCDIRLDFENVSGRHCILRFHKGVWHVRDLGSTNGTLVNGQKLASEHAVLPDDELSVASHLFQLDYDPVAPSQVLAANQVLEEELGAAPRRSLMELAGLETDNARSRRGRPDRPPERIERRGADDGFDDGLPADLPDVPAPKVAATDDDFFKMIEGDLIDPDGR